MKRETRVTLDHVTGLLRELHDEADRISLEIPEVETGAILSQAQQAFVPPEAAEQSAVPRKPAKRRKTNRRKPLGRAWIARSAAAAAVLAAATGALLLVRPQALPTGPIPAHLTALVDSLYPDPDSDYIHDEIGDLLGQPQGGGAAYLDDVWDSVITDLDLEPE